MKRKTIILAVVAAAAMAITLIGCGVKITNISLPERATMQNGESILITPFPKMCDTITIKGKEGESMKPIKLKELIATAKDPATQQIAIAENYTLYVVPLFEGLVKDVDKALAERILSDWRVETDSTRFIALVI